MRVHCRSDTEGRIRQTSNIPPCPSYTLEKDPGSVYGSIGDQLFKVDKATKATTVLLTKSGLDGLTTDDYGSLYYKIGETLHRFVVS